MDLKRIIQTAAEMRDIHSHLLDISDKTAYEAAFITILVKNNGIYHFLAEVQDISLEKIYAVCKFLDAQDELKKVHEKLQAN